MYDNTFPNKRYKITLDFFNSNELRRGGEDRFDLQPFEALTKEDQKLVYNAYRSGGQSIFSGLAISSDNYLKFLVDKLKIASSENLHVVAAGSNLEFINQVKKDPRAIGVVGSNWISDGDNPTSLGFIRSVNVVSVAEAKGMPYTQPFGYNLALKKYPLRREIKYILKEAHQGLGTGFLNYVSGDLGQLIVLKAGLIPLTRPITIRTYQINQ